MATEEPRKEEDAPEKTGWQYTSADGAQEAPTGHADVPKEPRGSASGGVEWTASEYAAHEKGFGWYLMLIIATVAVAGVIYLATRDVYSVGVAVIMAVMFGISGGRKPRVITYRADESGLTVGNKFYPYAAYKSFSIPQSGPFVTIELMPMKHLSLPVGAFLAPDSQSEVLEIVSGHLPMEHDKPGMIDELMHHLRF